MFLLPACFSNRPHELVQINRLGLSSEYFSGMSVDERAVEQLLQSIAAIRATKSWRLTWPLRATNRLIRG